MKIVYIIEVLCKEIYQQCSKGKCIGFVFIMGNLYEGYIILIKEGFK